MWRQGLVKSLRAVSAGTKAARVVAATPVKCAATNTSTRCLVYDLRCRRALHTLTPVYVTNRKSH